MILYSRRGLADWKRVSYQVSRIARNCLTNAGIAETEKEADLAIHEFWDPEDTSRLKFIPMPSRRKKGTERCFFLPIRLRKANGSESMGFELFVLVKGKSCLAFRFEPAHGNSVHGYGHVQLTKVLKKKTAKTPIPSWIPDSYPAFPIGTSDPLDVFLAMAVSVHGYKGGFLRVLQEVFQAANRPGDSAFYVKRLKNMLD